MFGELVTAYLFLAGVGAGGVAVASVADLLLVREPFGADVVPDFAEKRPAERLVVGVLAPLLQGAGSKAGCLAADLGRIDRVLSLFLTPPATLMNLGAWAVALLTVLAAALALARFLYLPWANRRAVVVAEVVACGLAVVGGLRRIAAADAYGRAAMVDAVGAGALRAVGGVLRLRPAHGRGAVRGRRRGRSKGGAGRCPRRYGRHRGGGRGGCGVFAPLWRGSDHAGVRPRSKPAVAPAALPWWVGFMACGLAAPLAVEVGCLVRERWRSRSGVGRDARAYPLGVPVSSLGRIPPWLSSGGRSCTRGRCGPAGGGGGGRRPAPAGVQAEASPVLPKNEAAEGLLSAFRKDGRQDGAAPERGCGPVVKQGKDSTCRGFVRAGCRQLHSRLASAEEPLHLPHHLGVLPAGRSIPRCGGLAPRWEGETTTP